MSYKYAGVNYIEHYRNEDFAYQCFALYSPNKIERRPTQLTLIKDKHKMFVLDNEREI